MLTQKQDTHRLKKLLAVGVTFTQFHQYVYGKEVDVESDHKPLESITKNPLSAALQRMLLQLQRYTCRLIYKPSKNMILADTLSCAYINTKPDNTDLEDDLICAVNLIVNNLPVSDHNDDIEEHYPFRMAREMIPSPSRV